MPTAALRPCATCGQVGCQAHKRGNWDHDHPAQRIRGRRLQRLRDRLFTHEPLCRICQQQGRVTVATIRDHIIPVFEGGSDTAENCQPLCAKCSQAKTQQESARGKRR